jgi:lon-related putative ATP-dependent protease
MRNSLTKPTNLLQPKELCWRCDPRDLVIAETEKETSLDGVLGQQRAVEAMNFGVSIRRDGFNVFALGPRGLGKQTLVMRILKEAAARRPTPSDWCYVHNFEHPHRPTALEVPAGSGAELHRDMAALADDFRAAIPAALEADEHRSRVHETEKESEAEHERMLQDLTEKASARGLRLLRTPAGFALAPTQGDEILSPEDFDRLPQQDKERIEQALRELRQELRSIVEKTPQLVKKARDKVRSLNREAAGLAVSHSIRPLRDKYAGLPQVLRYLSAVEEDAMQHASELVSSGEEPPNFLGIPLPGAENSLTRYQVNVFVDNSAAQGGPVVYEDHPSFQNLLGRIEHLSRLGTLTTDFTLLKNGALQRANGGYLVLDAARLLQQPFAWEGLKRALQSGRTKIESLGEALSLISTVSLDPEPIPLDVKVVLLGDRSLYYLFSTFEPDFPELFKVAADFDDELDRHPESCRLYGKFIDAFAESEKLLPFDSGASARVVEEAARWAGDSEKLSANTRNLGDLLREASHWATQAGAEAVQPGHVEKAIEQRDYRLGRSRELVQESIHRGLHLIDTSGAVTGQVNGLSVVGMADFFFGQPARITATARVGRGEVVDIEREVKLGGPLHSKGVLILSSFLSSRYCRDRPLSVAASLVFEQSYGAVEGDSASLAELCALLSVLAGAPIKQGLAVTGSVNQLGQVQAIGGVNEKIEGFFDICAARGLTGDQGVLIPAANVKHLMLRSRVVEAAAAGKFHVFPVSTVEQAIELLTGAEAGRADENGRYPSDSINGQVDARLREFSETIKAFVQEAKTVKDE